MLVQDIEKTVGKAPEKEEDGDESHGDERLPRCELRGAGHGFVAHFLVAALVGDGFGGGGTPVGNGDIVGSGVFLLSRHGDKETAS